MPGRAIRDQKAHRPAAWPPPVWPPLTWPDVPPIVPQDVPETPLDVDPGPLARAADLFVGTLLADDDVEPDVNPHALDPHRWVKDVLGEFMWSKQVQIAEAVRDHRRVAVPSAHETGKALALDTPLPTPTGWTTMGDVQVGDDLLDEQGQPCRVLAVSPVETKACSRVLFGNRDEIIASDDHLWSVLDIRRRPKAIRDWRTRWDLATTRTTADLRENRTFGGQARWKIPTTGPLAGAVPWSLPWGPYALGAWLGDGTTVRWEITCHVDDAAHYAVMTGGAVIPGRRETTRIVRPPGRVTLDCPSRVLTQPKHIPQAALRAPITDRLALLRGLMDTDGTVDRRNALCTIALTSKRLADGVAELIAGLGWVPWRSERPAKLDGRIVGTSYQIGFRPDVNPFSLPRKRDRWAGSALLAAGTQASARTQRTIRAITPVAPRPVKCVTVDSPRSLYLAGRGMIPTHNSWLAARIVAWWLSVWPAGDAFAVTTAPSAPQVRAILWREINRAHKKGQLPGRTNQTEWWIGAEMVAMGRKPADYSPTAFQGIHAKRVLVVIDEGCGVPAEIYRAAGSLIANEYGRILVIGNPDDPTSHFATICQPGSGWQVIPVSAFDTPNFTGEHVPKDVRDVLVNRIYTEELAADVGIDSPIYVSKALGQFPDHAVSGVVPLSFVRDCQRLDRDYAPQELVPIELGVDVGAGGDETVVRERRGRLAGRNWRRSTPDWAQAVAVVLDAIDQTGATRVKVDVIGIGWGVVGRLRELKRQGRHQAEIVAVDVRMASYAPTKYARLRDQLWWEIGRELSRSHGWDLSQIDDTTVNQLISPTWEPDSSGRVQVERKSDTRKRLKRSPDDADALLLAFYTPPRRQPGRPVAGGARRPYSAPLPSGQQRVVARLSVPRRPSLPARRLG